MEQSKEVSERTEIFNFKNPECFKQFQKMTENCDELVECFNDAENINLNEAASKWLKTLNNILKMCFKKIMLNRYQKNEELEKLFAACEEAKELLAISMNLEDED